MRISPEGTLRAGPGGRAGAPPGIAARVIEDTGRNRFAAMPLDYVCSVIGSAQTTTAVRSSCEPWRR